LLLPLSFAAHAGTTATCAVSASDPAGTTSALVFIEENYGGNPPVDPRTGKTMMWNCVQNTPNGSDAIIRSATKGQFHWVAPYSATTIDSDFGSTLWRGDPYGNNHAPSCPSGKTYNYATGNCSDGSRATCSVSATDPKGTTSTLVLNAENNGGAAPVDNSTGKTLMWNCIQNTPNGTDAIIRAATNGHFHWIATRANSFIDSDSGSTTWRGDPFGNNHAPICQSGRYDYTTGQCN